MMPLGRQSHHTFVAMFLHDMLARLVADVEIFIFISSYAALAQETLCYWRIASSQLGRGILPRTALLRGMSMIAKAVWTFHLP